MVLNFSIQVIINFCLVKIYYQLMNMGMYIIQINVYYLGVLFYLKYLRYLYFFNGLLSKELVQIQSIIIQIILYLLVV